MKVMKPARSHLRESGLAHVLIATTAVSIAVTTIYNSSLISEGMRSASEALLILLPLAGVVASAPKLASRRLPLIAVAIAALYAVSVILTTLLAARSNLPAFVLLAPAVMAVVFSFVGSILTGAEFRILSRWIIGLGILQVVISVAEVQVGAPWARALASTGDTYLGRPNLILFGDFLRASGTMGHPILLGLICTISAVLVLNKLVVTATVWRIVLVACLAWGVLLSGSRSSVAAFAFAVLLYFLHPHFKVRPGVRVAILLALIPLAWLYIDDAIGTARTVSAFSLNNRLDALPRLMDTLERPIGEALFGEGRRFALETVADNQFLTTSGRYGALALLVLCIAFVCAIVSRRPVATAVMGSLTLMSLSFDVLSWEFSALMFWLILGYSRGADEQTENSRALVLAKASPVIPRATPLQK